MNEIMKKWFFNKLENKFGNEFTVFQSRFGILPL